MDANLICFNLDLPTNSHRYSLYENAEVTVLLKFILLLKQTENG